MNTKAEGGRMKAVPQGDDKGSDTVRVFQSPVRQLTEYELAHAALQAAIVSRDQAGIDAARIWIARIQVERRQAQLLLREHLCERMERDAMRRKDEYKGGVQL